MSTPIYKDSFTSIVDSINTLNGLSLVVSEYDFGTPVPYTVPAPPSGIVLTQNQIAINARINTSITISAKGTSSTYQGSQTVYYHRMDLSELARQTNLYVGLKQVNTTQDIVDALNEKYGLILTASDIVIRDLTTSEKDLSTNPSITLEAVSSSYGWVGSVDVAVSVGGYLITDYINDTVIDAFNYPEADATKPFAAIYSYWRDFSSQSNLLEQVATGTNEIDLVRQALVSITGNPWTLTANARYSLSGASVVEVVATEDNPTSYNVRYDKCVRVALDPIACLGYEGDLYLHYNLPVEV